MSAGETAFEWRAKDDANLWHTASKADPLANLCTNTESRAHHVAVPNGVEWSAAQLRCPDANAIALSRWVEWIASELRRAYADAGANSQSSADTNTCAYAMSAGLDWCTANLHFPNTYACSNRNIVACGSARYGDQSLLDV